MPFTSLPATGATSWYPWGTDVHAIASHPLYEPIARYLPSNYVAGTTDIGPYVQAAADAIGPEVRGFMLLPPGTHFWNSTVYLNSTVREFGYALVGHGGGTYLNLGSGLNGTFAVIVNEDSGGNQVIASPGHPRLILENLTINGPGTSSTAGMVRSNMGGVTAQNLKCTLLYRLVMGRDYCDNMVFRNIRWQVGPTVTGAVMYYNHANGDGLMLEQISGSDDSTIVDITGTNGALITGAIVGHYRIAFCDAVTVVSPHNDGGDDNTGYQTTPSFDITSSRVSFYGGWDQIGTTTPAILVNDNQVLGFSEVLIDGWNFGFRPHTAAKVRSPHVTISAAQPSTKVRFRRCGSNLLPENVTTRYPSGPSLSSSVTGIQAAFDAYPTAMLEDVDLVQTPSGWAFISPPPMMGRSFLNIPTAPTVAAATTTSGPGTFTAGTFFYKVAVYTDKTRGLHTAASAEASVAMSGVLAAQLTITTNLSPALTRVWRGTSTGVYDRYVDVPLSGYSQRTFDSGPALNGYAWITTGVPTPPTTNTTMDGQVRGTRVEFSGAAAPTEGTWARGNRVTDTTPSASGTEGWVCTAAGTPGTWKTFGSIGA